MSGVRYGEGVVDESGGTGVAGMLGVPLDIPAERGVPFTGSNRLSPGFHKLPPGWNRS